MVNKNLKVLVSLSTVLLITSCSIPVTNNDSVTNTNVVTNMQNSKSISGKVQFPEKFNTKATINDVAVKATVSLIYPSDHVTNANVTIATGLTTATGSFVINPSSTFSPVIGDIFVLEAIKRIGGAGNASIAVRTNLKWMGTSWTSISGSNIIIDSKTTAISIISSLNKTDLSSDKTIGVIINGMVENIANTTVTSITINNVKDLVEQSLTDNNDPLNNIIFSNNTFSLKPTNAIITGCIINTSACGLILNSISPSNASSGEIITITGTNFDTVNLIQNKVKFVSGTTTINGEVLSATTNQLKVKLPIVTPAINTDLSGLILVNISNSEFTIGANFTLKKSNLGTVLSAGNLTVDTVWTKDNSPYILNSGDIAVNQGIKLTIEPGVTVSFGDNAGLIINGALIAKGTVDNRINFQPITNALPWKQIKFSNTSTPALYTSGNYTNGSIMQYCNVTGAKGDTDNLSAIYAYQNAPFIDNCSIKNNTATGIQGTSLKTDITISNSDISNNTTSGIKITKDTGLVSDVNANVINNIISNNKEAGSYTSGFDNLSIKDNTFSFNTSFAANTNGIKNMSFKDNILDSNGWGFYSYGNTNNIIERNQIKNSVTEAGIYINSPFNNSSLINKNTITGNKRGILLSGLPFTDNTNIDNYVLTNNTISNNKGIGINIEQSIKLATLSNNDILNNEDVGISGFMNAKASIKLSINLNNIYGNKNISKGDKKGTGIYIASDSFDTCFFTSPGNCVSSSGGSFFFNSSGLSITNNNFSDGISTNLLPDVENGTNYPLAMKSNYFKNADYSYGYPSYYTISGTNSKINLALISNDPSLSNLNPDAGVK